MNERTFTRIWRWSLLVTVPWAAFWAWFYIRHGFIPVNGVVSLWGRHDLTYNLPFEVSRLFDILIAPLWICTLPWLWRHSAPNKQITDIVWSEWVAAMFVISVFLGLFYALVVGIASGFANTLATAAGLTLLVLLIKAIGILIKALDALRRWADVVD